MTALRRYRLFLLLLLGGTAALAFGLNTWVNPWRVTPSPWSSESLDEHRAVDNAWNRTAKAGLVRSGTWEAAIFGSSRVDIALDPEHPFFGGRRCVNLGLNAANLVENHAIFRYFVDRQQPELVVFALDAGDLTSAPRERNPTDFSLSPLDHRADPFERELRYRFGISTLRSSIETLERSARGEPAEHSPQGFRYQPPFPEDQRAIIAGLYTSTIIRLDRARAELDGTSPRKLELLADVIATCRERGIRLFLLITPNHALFQTAFLELGHPDPCFARDRRAILEALATDGTDSPSSVEVWDFLDAHPLNCEPLPPAGRPGARMEHWPDLFHVTPVIGGRMLDRMAGSEGDYGVRLTPGEIDERMDAIRSGLGKYVERHPDDVRFIEQALARYTGGGRE